MYIYIYICTKLKVHLKRASQIQAKEGHEDDGGGGESRLAEVKPNRDSFQAHLVLIMTRTVSLTAIYTITDSDKVFSKVKWV